MKHCLTFFLMLLAFLPAIANDGIYYMNGNHLVPLTETNIEVRKEVLSISLLDDGYALVDVQYQFFNPTSATKHVVMGFEANPPWGDWHQSLKSSTHPYMRDFTVEMNGHSLSYQSAMCSSFEYPIHPIDTTKRYYLFDNMQLYEEGTGPEYDNDAEGTTFSFVYYFDAEFLPGINTVHHTYAYKLSIINIVPYALDYKLSPAARWANGKIDDFTLIIRAQNTAKHFKVDRFCNNGVFSVTEGMGKIRKCTTLDGRYESDEVSLRNGAITMHLSDFVPTEDLQIWAGFNFSLGRDGRYHIGQSYDRSIDREIEFLESDYNTLEPADTAFAVRLLHNLPYANRGYVFKNEQLRQFFESQWWYMPDPDYHPNDEDFTDIDRRYVTFHFSKK